MERRHDAKWNRFNWRGTKMWEIFKSFIAIGRVARCVTLVQRMSVIRRISTRETHDNQRVRKIWWMRVLWCHFTSESKRARAAMKCYKVDSCSLDISRPLIQRINAFEEFSTSDYRRMRGISGKSCSTFPIRAIASPNSLISNLLDSQELTSSVYRTVGSILLRVIGARHTKGLAEKRVR